MKVFIAGATGKTGKLLVDQLLKTGHNVKVIVRTTSHTPGAWDGHPQVTIVRGDISSMTLEEMAKHLLDCDVVAFCLGHNLTLKGIFGKPRKLVTQAVRLVCIALLLDKKEKPVRFVLMNTAGNRNRDLQEPYTVGEKMVTGLLRLMLPPHPDNEQAADYLRVTIGQNNPTIEWVVVRPDTLINEPGVTAYTLYGSPVRSAIFNPGKTSRINVANFMAKLITEDDVFHRWKGKMPVIYNGADS